MTTQRIVVPAGQWVKVTDVSTGGSMRLHFGSIQTTEQATLPTGTPQDTPKTTTMNGSGDEKPYRAINTGEFMYAYGLTDSELDVTPDGGLL